MMFPILPITRYNLLNQEDVFEEAFVMKFQIGSVLKYLNYQMIQPPVGFSVDQTDHIMELVNEWLPTGKFRNINTPFKEDYIYKKELTDALPLTRNTLHNKKWNTMEDLDIIMEGYNTLLL